MAANKFQLAGIAATLLLGGFAITHATAFAPPRTTLDGVFTQEQLQRGLTAYTGNCARCHQPDLNGTGGAPPLRTTSFTERWRESYLSNLFHHMQTWMPPQNLKGTLKEQQYLDLVAYVLSANDFPAGAKELTKPDLDTVLFVEQDGPKALPPAATVRAVGCLGKEDEWTLTRVGDMPRVNDGSDTYPSEVAWSQQVPLGTNSIKLPDLEDDHKPADLQKLLSKKVQAKGVLNGEGANRHITVFSLEPLDSTVGPQCSN